MLVRDYWNTLGVRKDFEDPVYLDKLTPYLTKDSYIVEYGWGYGRMMNILHNAGYHNPEVNRLCCPLADVATIVDTAVKQQRGAYA